MNGPFPPSWRFLAADLGGLSASLLVDGARLERALERAFGAPPQWFRHEYFPHGLSLIGVSARLRVALHTWPEFQSMTLDLWCAEAGDALLDRAVRALKDG